MRRLASPGIANVKVAFKTTFSCNKFSLLLEKIYLKVLIPSRSRDIGRPCFDLPGGSPVVKGLKRCRSLTNVYLKEFQAVYVLRYPVV